MEFLNLQSEKLMVDWISFNIQGLPDPKITGSELRLFSLGRMLHIVITLSICINLIGKF